MGDEVEEARARMRAEYERLYLKSAKDLDIREVVNAVFHGTAQYLEFVSSLGDADKGQSVIPPNAEKLELASFIYESRKISFPDIEEPHPAVVIASPIKYLPAAAPPKVKPHEEEVTWQNWNKNHSTKAEIVHPTTVEELIHVVKRDKKVRVAGFGHSWSPIVATREDDKSVVLVKTDGLKRVLSHPEDVSRTKTITVETGVSIQELEDWLVHPSRNIHLTIASNVVLTELHLGAVVSPACHGAGYEWGSVADFVKAVSIINAKGELVTYIDKATPVEDLALPRDVKLNVRPVDTAEFNHYKATLGLLGVVYAVTLQLVASAVLRYHDDVTVTVDDLLDPIKLKAKISEFNGWVEIFWLPGKNTVLLKNWKIDKEGHPPNNKPPPDNSEMGNSLYKAWQKFRLGGPGVSEKFYMDLVRSGFYALAEKNPVYFNWFRAIHFQAGITKMQVEDTEFSFEIRDNDYTVVSTAFRHMKEAIDAWEEKKYYPVDITCEMRFTAGSEATLAHYQGKNTKWVHMEFLGYTSHGVGGTIEERWNNVVHTVANKWIALGGNPHWAKGWHLLDNVYSKLKEKPYVQKFNEYRKQQDPHGKFLNATLARIFG